MKTGDIILLLVVLGIGAAAVWFFLFRTKVATAGVTPMTKQQVHLNTLAGLAAAGRSTITQGELAQIKGVAVPVGISPTQITRTTKPPVKRNVFGARI